MDNFRIDITSEGPLNTAFSLFSSYRKVTGYRVEGNNKIVLYWTDSPKASKLPFPMTMQEAATFVEGWLKHADYGDEPGIDGDVGKGWRVYCESWGHVDGEWQAFLAIVPVWALYGK